MKRIALAVLLLSSMCFAGKKPNPADYPINVHVTGSRLEGVAGGGCTQYLDGEIDGLHYSLSGGCDRPTADIFGGFATLKPGGYKAKLVEDDRSTPFRVMQTYELLFPDGTTRKFGVYGVSE